MLTDKKNIIFIAALFVAVTLFFIFRGSSSGVSFDLNETSLSVTGPDNYSYSFEFSDVSEAELLTDFNEGNCVSGGTAKNYTYGVWNNDTLGEYNVCKLTKLSSCISVRLNDGSYFVFNVENASSTSEFYENLLKYVK